MNQYGIAKCLILTWYSLRNHGLNVELFEISLIYWIFPTLKGISHLCFRWNTPLICWCVDWKFGACSWRDNIIVWNHSYYNGIRGKPTIPTLDQTDLSTSRWMWLYAMEIYRGFMKFYVEYRRNTKELHITRRKPTDADKEKCFFWRKMARWILRFPCFPIEMGIYS